jgi:predicted GNAT family N-acyltransferase
MATSADLRGHGIGAELIAATVRHIAVSGGGLLWCNARVPAEAFYARAGFLAMDNRWDDPLIGPHVGMLREVSAS